MKTGRRITIGLLLLLAAPLALAGTHVERSFATGPHAELVIDASAGRIDVRGVDDGEVRVVVDSNKDLEERYTLSFDQQGPQVTVRLKRRTGLGSLMPWNWNWNGGRTSFTVEVPRESNVDLDTSGGGIEVRELRGSVRADTSGGGISVERIEGDVLADTSGGGIDVSEVTGAVSADTSGGGIRISDVSGPVKADTSGGGITVERAGAEVDADTSGGPIRVSFLPGNAEGGRLDTSGGGVTVRVDPSVGLEIDAETSGGGVHSDLPITATSHGDRDQLRGTLNGGGKLLTLRSSGGGIRILPL